MTRLLRRHLHRLDRGEDGFTLVELTVAMMVTLVVMSSLIGLYVGSLRTIALAKQRQAGAALATGVMEQLRALDYGTLSSGMVCSDLSGDSNVTGSCPGTVTFTSPTGGITETVKAQTSTPAAAIAPIYPHRTTRTLENATYTVSTYITNASTTAPAFNLTVLVTWTTSASQTQKTVIQRSTEFSPSRCLSSATHPFSGACQAAFGGQAGLSNAGITVTEASSGTGAIPGFDLKSLELSLPGLSTGAAVEQVTKLSTLAQTSAGTVITGSGGTTTTGGASGTAAADTDPSSTSAGSQSSSVSQSGTSTLAVDGTAGRLKVGPLTSDSGAAATQTSATSGSCLDSAGTALSVTGRPCSNGTIQASGTSGRLSYNPTTTLRTFDVASVAASPTPSRAVVARVTGSGGTACPSANGVGCITAQASRSLGTVKLGALPAATDASDVLPAGWTGQLLQVDNLTETAYADSGLGARATPGYTRSSGTLTWYDPSISSTRTVNLATLTGDQTINPPAVNATYQEGLSRVGVTIDTQFTVGAPVPAAPSTSATDPQCKTAACSAKASVSSVVRATFEYTFTLNGLPLTHFYVIADLGSVLAQTSYKAAFDA